MRRRSETQTVEHFSLLGRVDASLELVHALSPSLSLSLFHLTRLCAVVHYNLSTRTGSTAGSIFLSEVTQDQPTTLAAGEQLLQLFEISPPGQHQLSILEHAPSPLLPLLHLGRGTTACIPTLPIAHRSVFLPSVLTMLNSL